MKKAKFKGDKAMRVRTERAVMLFGADHPFIIKLHFAFQDGDNLCLVMDFCPGGDLCQLLSLVGAFDEESAAFYMAEILASIQSIHKEGFVHRDLKPSNFLINEKGHLILTDFGLAKKVMMTKQRPISKKKEKESASHTSADTSQDQQNHQEDPPQYSAPSSTRVSPYSGSPPSSPDHSASSSPPNPLSFSVVGTPNYIAPEVLMGEGYGRASDYWSAGCMLFELICGYAPFIGDSPQSVFNSIRARGYNPPPRPPDLVSDLAWDLICNLLTEPSNRLGVGKEKDQRGFDSLMRHPFFDCLHEKVKTALKSSKKEEEQKEEEKEEEKEGSVDLSKKQQTLGFQLLHHISPPFIPQLSSSTDLTYFADAMKGKGSVSLEIDDIPLFQVDWEESDDVSGEQRMTSHIVDGEISTSARNEEYEDRGERSPGSDSSTQDTDWTEEEEESDGDSQPFHLDELEQSPRTPQDSRDLSSLLAEHPAFTSALLYTHKANRRGREKKRRRKARKRLKPAKEHSSEAEGMTRYKSKTFPRSNATLNPQPTDPGLDNTPLAEPKRIKRAVLVEDIPHGGLSEADDGSTEESQHAVSESASSSPVPQQIPLHPTTSQPNLLEEMSESDDEVQIVATIPHQAPSSHSEYSDVIMDDHDDASFDSAEYEYSFGIDPSISEVTNGDYLSAVPHHLFLNRSSTPSSPNMSRVSLGAGDSVSLHQSQSGGQFMPSLLSSLSHSHTPHHTSGSYSRRVSLDHTNEGIDPGVSGSVYIHGLASARNTSSKDLISASSRTDSKQDISSDGTSSVPSASGGIDGQVIEENSDENSEKWNKNVRDPFLEDIADMSDPQRRDSSSRDSEHRTSVPALSSLPFQSYFSFSPLTSPREDDETTHKNKTGGSQQADQKPRRRSSLNAYNGKGGLKPGPISPRSRFEMEIATASSSSRSSTPQNIVDDIYSSNPILSTQSEAEKGSRPHIPRLDVPNRQSSTHISNVSSFRSSQHSRSRSSSSIHTTSLSSRLPPHMLPSSPKAPLLSSSLYSSFGKKEHRDKSSRRRRNKPRSSNLRLKHSGSNPILNSSGSIHELEDPFDSTDLPLPSSPKQSSCRSARETSRIIDTSNLTAPLHDESVNSSDILPSLEASGS
ncbi:hypothetical protein ADUPG1_009725, partial [Aduncisulcus paluster]